LRFARQDLGKDPPFSRMDIISCRNVLIYLGQDLQNRVIPSSTMRSGRNGYLLLGNSETVGSSPLFATVDKNHRIYIKQPVTDRPAGDYQFNQGMPDSPRLWRRKSRWLSFDLTQEADRAVLARYGPPGVVINEKLEIIQFAAT